MSDFWKQVLNKINPETSLFQVLVYLAFSKEPCKPAEISKYTGLLPGTIRPAIRSLLKMGFVYQDQNGLYRSKIPFTVIVSDIFQHLLKK